MPTPRDHDRTVIAVGFAANNGFRKSVLDQKKTQYNIPLIPEAEVCNTEKEMLQKAFKIIDSYPIILTYNGDDFDLPYLYARSQDPRIDPITKLAIPKDEVPNHSEEGDICETRDSSRASSNKTWLTYRFVQNFSEQIRTTICF